MRRKRLDIFYSIEDRSPYLAMHALQAEYGEIIDVRISHPLDLDPSCFSSTRKQYDANCLLSRCLGHDNLFLWIVHEDLFTGNLNFVFGCAIPFKGAILSTYRLRSEDLIEKEAIHEVGHVLGLKHCSNECVMGFSNSLYEAMLKPKTLCRSCRKKLKEIHSHV